LSEAETLFSKYGIRSMTMDDIARQVGISKKTIYQHFTDKDEIVYQVVHYRIANDKHYADCQLADVSNPIEEMLMVSEMMRTQLANVNPSMLIDIQRLYPRAWALFVDYRDKFILEAIRRNLIRGIEQGLYRSDIDVDIFSRLRIELVQLGFDSQVFPITRTTLLDVQMQLLHHFIRGILSDKGFSSYNQFLTKYRNDQLVTHK